MRILPSSGLLRRFLFPALILSAVPGALAQLPSGAVVQPLPSDSDPAELLARALRTLAVEPNNLQALTAAGHNALVLGDANAAVGFFGRAQEIAPRDGRVKAGLGSALVQLEKPQDALRLFSEASRLGVPDADIAEDRGLAYDLTGDPRKAQRDYQTVLAAHPEDDTARRRLALSQGISGDKQAALATLDPLIRKRDIAGWRAQTFVLAMNGDAKGASDITHVMMPQQADMLQPFLVRLGSLSAVDKAKAVHFGEMPAAGRSYTSTQLANIGGTPPTYAPAPAPVRPAPRSDLAPLPTASARPATPAPTYTPAPAPTPAAVVATPGAIPTVSPNAPALAPIQTTTLPPSNPAPLLAQAATPPAATVTPPPPDLSGMPMPMPATVGHYDLPHVAADRRTASTPVYHAPAKASPVVEEEDCVTVKVAPAKGHHAKGKGKSHAAAKTKTVCTVKGSKSSAGRGSSSADQGEDCRTVKVPGSRHHKATTKTVCKPSRSSSDDSSSRSSSSGADQDCTKVKVPATRHHKATTKTVCKPSRSSDDSSSSRSSSSGADQDCTKVKVPATRHHKATTKTVCKPSRSDDSSRSSASSGGSGADQDCTKVKVAATRHHKATTKTVCKPSTSSSDDSGKSSLRSGGASADQDCTTVKVPATRHHKATTKTVCKPAASDDSGSKPSKSPKTSAAADEGDDCKTVKVPASHHHKATTKTVCKSGGSSDDKSKASSRKSASDDADDSSTRSKSSKGKAAADDDSDKPTSKAGARVYVQVAGGSNKADLDKAWAGVKKKAPELMKGHTPSTTSARATNRLMVGPFKSDEEAQAFVNKMSAKGMSGFVVKTTKGQKVEKVDTGQ